jgi:myosin-5
MMTEQEEKNEADTDDSLSLAPKAKKNVFVRSEEHVWLPARIVEQTDEEAVVQVFDLDPDGRLQMKTNTNTKREQVRVCLADYPPQNALPLKNVNEYGDMIDLPFLHEPGILYNLRTRFLDDKPYTRTGDILIAVNPYQWLSHTYTTEIRKNYMPDATYDPAAPGMVKKSLEPHVYEIAAMAYRGLTVCQKNQSILVSGESGAGKTETVKICLDHIATIQGGLKRPTTVAGAGTNTEQQQHDSHQVVSSIVQRVVDSNPLLEAFGNAKTVRNDNSSRFGKFVQLQFDQSSGSSADDNKLVGSHIEVYLLEKSRVVSHAAGERNFHIFYQLLAAPDDMKRKINADVLVGKSPGSFPYLGSRNAKSLKMKRRRSSVGFNNSSSSIMGTANFNDDNEILIDNMSDVQWFEQTVKDLETIGIKDETLMMLMRALCVVLQLGTIQFVGDSEDNAMISGRQTSKGGEFAKLANLIGIETDVFCKAFTNKTIMAGSTEINSPLSPQQAKEGCDAYAKDLYSKIFSWLVGTINAATSASAVHSKANDTSTTVAGGGDVDSSKQEHGLIGVLDIFGFEAFETNHFEQLCINYANERLQYMFASNVFVGLIDEYAREGLVVDFSYETNTNVLDLIAGKVGILATLNEECIRPGGSDVEFVYKALNQNKNSPRMFKTDLFTRYQFGIRHYAGPVVYTANAFLSTNKDIMPIDLQKVSRSSTNTIIAAEYAEPVTASGGSRPARGRTNMVKNTVVSKFRTQLNSLLRTLTGTQTRYIRCIKPNRVKQPRIMENTEIMRQLSSGGVIAAIKIASASYPNKMEHHYVVKRFRNLGNKPDRSQGVTTQVATLLATALKDFVSPIKGGTARPPTTIGKTRTYFRTGALEYLENARNDNIGFFAVIIQRSYRMSPVRRSFLRQREAAVTIQALMRGFFWKKRCERMPDCAVTIQCWCRSVLARRRLKKHKSATKIQRRWCAAREGIRLERCTKASIDIQKVARGSIQRPNFRKELVQKTRSAVLFQMIVRGYIQFVKFRAILERKRLEELQAAIQIQKVARGYGERVKFKVAIERELARKTKATVHIQKIVKGHIQFVKYRVIRKAEEERIAAEKAAEEARLKAERLVAEKAAEAEQRAAEKAAQEARLKAERLAAEKAAKEKARLKAERRVAEKAAKEEARLKAKRLAAEQAAEEEARLKAERLAAEKAAEDERLAVERRVEEERLIAERLAEEKVLAAEKQAEEERLGAEKIAEEERLAAEILAEEERLEAERVGAERQLEKEDGSESARIAALEERLAAAEIRAGEERLKAEKLSAENASLEDRISNANNAEKLASAENAAVEKAIQSAQEKAAVDNALKEEPEKDEELELALEMALLAGQHSDLPPEELNQLLGKPTLDEEFGGGFLGRMVGGFRRMAQRAGATAPATIIVGAPWAGSEVPSMGHFLESSGGNGRRGLRDDDTFAESVVTMMIPDSLTAEQLRSRRKDLKLQQDNRKLRKKISEKSRELRMLRKSGDKTRASNKENKRVIAERQESATMECENRLQRLPYDDHDMEFIMTALEEASVALGLGSCDDQKERMSEEEKLQFDVQILQEAQLVRLMREMYVTGQQKFRRKKHDQREVDYLKSCQTWLSDHSSMNTGLHKMESLVEEMTTLCKETLRSQEAAFARHDADMTIRETIEDLF